MATKAPSKPGSPVEKTEPTPTPATDAPAQTSKPMRKAVMQKTVTIPLGAELEKLLDSNSAKVEAEYGFKPTQAQSITTLINQLLKAAK